MISIRMAASCQELTETLAPFATEPNTRDPGNTADSKALTANTVRFGNPASDLSILFFRRNTQHNLKPCR